MIFIVLAAVTGLLTVMSRMVNASLGRAIGSMPGSFVNHLVGTLGAGVILVLAWRTGLLKLVSVPWIYWTGGCIGVLVVAASNYAVRTVGAALFAVLLLTGQIFTSALIDHYGLMGEIHIQMTPLKLLGLGLLLGGALLVLAENRAPVNPATDTQAPERTRTTSAAPTR